MNFSEIRVHLSKFSVGIAGAGGLGSNCAVALARSGVGKLVIADYDTIEETNLNRQYFFSDQIGQMKTKALKDTINRINLNVNVMMHEVRLDTENIPVIFSGCNVIVEALDRSEMKEMLIETVQLKMRGTPVIVGSGVAGWGQSESIRLRKIDGTLYVCGDESTEISSAIPPMAPRVGMVANMQANMVIELLMNMS